MESVPAELEAQEHPCDMAQLTACTPSAVCQEGGGMGACETSREFRTATQRQDLSGVAVQAMCVWECVF